MLRRLLLYLSAAKWARGLVMRWGVARTVARRFIAGETIDDALNASRQLNEQGLLVSLDYLGESVESAADTQEVGNTYRRLIELIQQLVRCKSTLGNEAEPQQIIADYIRESGVEPDVWDLNDTVLALPGAGNSRGPFAGRPNVAAVYPGSGHRR